MTYERNSFHLYINHLQFILICSNRSVNYSVQLAFIYVASVINNILSKRITEAQNKNSDQDQKTPKKKNALPHYTVDLNFQESSQLLSGFC